MLLNFKDYPEPFKELLRLLKAFNQFRVSRPYSVEKDIGEVEDELGDFKICYSEALKSYGLFPKSELPENS